MLQIVVVQRGDTLYTLAQRYGTTIENIVLNNGLNASQTLVVGQALLVNTPDNLYYVQPGDSLYKIALTYNTSYTTLAKVNNLSLNSTLQVGQRLYVPVGKEPSKESIAYLQPTSVPVKPYLFNATRAVAPFLTYLAYFTFEPTREGTLKEPQELSTALEIARRSNTIPMLVVTNIENYTFGQELAKTVLVNPTIQNKLITNIVQTAQKYNMRDVHIDFEDVAPEDREAYNQFLRNLKARLPEGYLLSTALVPKTSSEQKGRYYEAHDYAAHGKIVDFVVLMTYDWGWQGGSPQAVSPIGPVKKVVEYAKTQMPASKIMLGQNLYGFDWILPYKPGNPPAKALSSLAAVQLARQNNVPIQYDDTVQEPNFTYTDEQGRLHQVWFEDARSVQAKMNLIKQEGLRGISYWKIGLPFPQNWQLLTSNFDIVKKG